MDVLSHVELQVDSILKAANPALFCTARGGPITFHLEVGEGEENLVRSVRKTVNSYGGRYIKRYHEMTPFTVLLVTDCGFRSETYNRPAVCVTYIGDCVHTNSLRNVNEYLHPWENQNRWKTVNLFEVMYSQNRKFQCSSRFVLTKSYVPVSRMCKTEEAPKTKPLVQNCSESSETVMSSDDDSLFKDDNNAETRTSTSDATTNVRPSPCPDVQPGLSIETRSVVLDERPPEHPTMSNDDNAHEGSAAICEESDDCSPSIIIALDQHPTQCINQPEINRDPLQSVNQLEKLCSVQSSKNSKCKTVLPRSKPSENLVLKSHQKRSDEVIESGIHKYNRVAKRNPVVLLERLSGDFIQAKTSASAISDQKNAKESSRNCNTLTASSENNKDELAVAKRKLIAILEGTEEETLQEQKLPEDLGEPSEHLTPRIISCHTVPSRSIQGPDLSKPSKKLGTKTAASKPPRKKCLQLQITIKNSRKDRQNRIGKINQRKRNSKNDEELLSDGENSSSSDVEYLPVNTPTLDISNESSVSSNQNSANQRTSLGRGTNSNIGLVTPKSEFKEETPEILKKRGRGYQDRYRTIEKVTMLKWLVEHKKFRNLRGVLVWREMERKQVVPGRPYQSLKNQFLKHLLPNLNNYSFLTKEHKRKFRGVDTKSSDEDEGFFYHGSSHNFQRDQ